MSASAARGSPTSEPLSTRLRVRLEIGGAAGAAGGLDRRQRRVPEVGVEAPPIDPDARGVLATAGNRGV